MKVLLRPNAEVLDEVVVVAYGTQKRASITGAVSAVNAEEIEKRPVTNVTSALEGTTTGVQVNSTYGEPGNSSNNIRIRGFGSINGTNEPLIVVDGVPYSGSLNDINSSDIESMSVLKDASSAALYGNKAANGSSLSIRVKARAASWACDWIFAKVFILVVFPNMNAWASMTGWKPCGRDINNIIW